MPRHAPARTHHERSTLPSHPDGNGELMLTDRPAYKKLQAHFETASKWHLRDLFAADPQRGTTFTAEGAGLYLDYSKHRIQRDTVDLLIALANDCHLRDRIEAMFRGDHVNNTEDRKAWHTQLR